MAERAVSIRFDSDEPEFVRGFEAGRILATLNENPGETFTRLFMHISNVEMAMRIAEALDRQATSRELEDGWMEVTFEPTGTLSQSQSI